MCIRLFVKRMADDEDFSEDIPLPSSEAYHEASEAGEATPPPEMAEPEPEVRDLSTPGTPTQDELPQLISSLVPGVSASGIQAATSALSGIPLPSSNNPSGS